MISYLDEKWKQDWSTHTMPSLEGVDEKTIKAFYELFAYVLRREEEFRKHRHKIQEGHYSEKPAW